MLFCLLYITHILEVPSQIAHNKDHLNQLKFVIHVDLHLKYQAFINLITSFN